MDEKLIECVARKIHIRWYSDPWNNWETLTLGQKNRWMTYAQDAIEAIDSYKDSGNG